MRLSKEQVEHIKAAVARHFGAQAEVRLFGSRIDDQARGGDIDLYIESRADGAREALAAEMGLWAELQHRLGERRVDLPVAYPGMRERPVIYEVARRQGVVL